MALYIFVGIFCSFIAVDITKFLISKKASSFLNFLNRFAVASLSIILANLLGLAWLMLYSEFFVKAWFPEMYQFGQMLIAFLGASIWMSIFFVPLFHYLHIKNKVQYKKWIYSAFLIVIIALPLSFALQYGESLESNIALNEENDSDELKKIKTQIADTKQELESPEGIDEKVYLSCEYIKFTQGKEEWSEDMTSQNINHSLEIDYKNQFILFGENPVSKSFNEVSNVLHWYYIKLDNKYGNHIPTTLQLNRVTGILDVFKRFPVRTIPKIPDMPPLNSTSEEIKEWLNEMEIMEKEIRSIVYDATVLAINTYECSKTELKF